ncbi:MAG: DUF3709 domain-containing protein [Clostridiaceae bacterium]|nr:DUF3709 domain-containing protein [Clostridiaceae bacterium]
MMCSFKFQFYCMIKLQT